MRIGLAVGSLALFLSSVAWSDDGVEIDRSVFIERVAAGARALEPATTLKKGDKIVLVVEWRAAPGRRGLTVESAVPRSLAFQRAGSDAVEVSADGGRSWGRLGMVRIAGRLASAEDVTHLRVAAVEQRGRLTYSAIVR